MNKKLLLLALASIAPTSFATELGIPTFVIDSCDGNIGFNNCKMRDINERGSQTSQSTGKSKIQIATEGIAAGAAGLDALLAEDKTSGLFKTPNIKGVFNSRVPGGNPFVFCSGGRPSRKNPLRPVYDAVCPAGKVTPEQVAQKNGLANHMNDAKDLTSKLATAGTSSLIGIGLSEAAKKTLGGTQDIHGNSLSVANNMSLNQYNRQLYNQIQHENYLRQQEEWKARQDPEYVKKIIPDSSSYVPSQTVINNQKQVFDNLVKNTQSDLAQFNGLMNTPNLTAEQIQRQAAGVSAVNVQTQNVNKSVTNATTNNTSNSAFTSAFK